MQPLQHVDGAVQRWKMEWKENVFLQTLNLARVKPAILDTAVRWGSQTDLFVLFTRTSCHIHISACPSTCCSLQIKINTHYTEIWMSLLNSAANDNSKFPGRFSFLVCLIPLILPSLPIFGSSWRVVWVCVCIHNVWSRACTILIEQHRFFLICKKIQMCSVLVAIVQLTCFPPFHILALEKFEHSNKMSIQKRL